MSFVVLASRADVLDLLLAHECRAHAKEKTMRSTESLYFRLPSGNLISKDELSGLKATEKGLVVLGRDGNPFEVFRCSIEEAERMRDELATMLKLAR